MDSTSDVAEALAHVKANSINVAVGSADCVLDAVEAILHARIDCVEAIAQTVGDTTELGVYFLCVEALKKVGAS